MTQDGWALELGYGRATVRRWEAGETIPSAHAEEQILSLCHERALYRRFTDGPMAGVHVTPEWLADLLASARLENAEGPSPSASSAISAPETRYALSGDVAIAYQVFGTGPIDLVVTPGLVSHRELDWEHPAFARFLSRLATFARVVIFDKRGTGMSDRVAAGTLEERMDDIRAVMDAAGMRRATLFGISEGGPMSILFAATYPERTRALVLYGAYARDWHPVQHPLGTPMPPMQEVIDRIRRDWGVPGPGFLRRYAPSLAGDPDEQEWWARYQRISASPGAAIALVAMNRDIDIRHVLPAIRVPTLVLHRRGDQAVDVEHGRYLAEQIPGARYVELDGIDHLPMFGDLASIADEVESFATDSRAAVDLESVLATVMSTTVTGCTPEGDAGSGPRLTSYLESVRRELVRYRGNVVEDDGDTILARFDGPTRAVRCAASIRNIARTMGLESRTGLHTGELELHEDGVSGSAIGLSVRIATLAQPGEILVSNTVTDLVPGSGFEFDDRGLLNVEGIQGEWRLSSLRGAHD